MPSPCRPSSAHVARAVLLCAVLAACSSKETKTAQNTSIDSIPPALAKFKDTANPFGGAAAPQPAGPPTGKIRIANLLEIGGKPSGAVDVYDMVRPDSATKPLIAHLGFGEVSAYVSPRAPADFQGVRSNLYMFPAGQRKASLPFGTNLENLGFLAADQVTVVLGPSSMAGPAIASFDVPEEGLRIPKAQQDSQHVIPPGKALLIVRDADRDLDTLPERYIMVDGACPHPPNVKGTFPVREGVFPIAPGTHTLGVVTSPLGHGLNDCSGKHPGATTALAVTAGRRYLALVYGLPSDGFKVAAAPIDPTVATALSKP